MDVSSADPNGSCNNSNNDSNSNDTNSGDEDGDRPSAPKKRRLDLPSAWTNLVGHVVSLKTSPEVAPWLQIIDERLNLFPDSPNLQVRRWSAAVVVRPWSSLSLSCSILFLYNYVYNFLSNFLSYFLSYSNSNADDSP